LAAAAFSRSDEADEATSVLVQFRSSLGQLQSNLEPLRKKTSDELKLDTGVESVAIVARAELCSAMAVENQSCGDLQYFLSKQQVLIIDRALLRDAISRKQTIELALADTICRMNEGSVAARPCLDALGSVFDSAGETKP
jgi:hypothetical protein